MRFYNRIEAVCRMNRLGAERRPFLFVIDYKQEQVIVEEPDQIDSEALLYNLDGVTNVVTASRMNDRENRTSAIRWETFPITQSAYADSFHKVVGHIRAWKLLPGQSDLRHSCSDRSELEGRFCQFGSPV